MLQSNQSLFMIVDIGALLSALVKTFSLPIEFTRSRAVNKKLAMIDAA
jgi:hypothetical protein